MQQIERRAATNCTNREREREREGRREGEREEGGKWIIPLEWSMKRCDTFSYSDVVVFAMVLFEAGILILLALHSLLYMYTTETVKGHGTKHICNS